MIGLTTHTQLTVMLNAAAQWEKQSRRRTEYTKSGTKWKEKMVGVCPGCAIFLRPRMPSVTSNDSVEGPSHYEDSIVEQANSLDPYFGNLIKSDKTAL